MGNCTQCIGRDCGFKYEKYCGKNKQELDEYLREKLKTKFEFHAPNNRELFSGISEKSPQYEEDSIYPDDKRTNNYFFYPEMPMQCSLDVINERNETEIINKSLNLKHFKEKNHLNITKNEEIVTKPIIPPSKPSPILSSPKQESKLLKTSPDMQYGFQNKIFDFKEIQSPNVIFQDYGEIFKNDDFSDTSIDEKDQIEIEKRFPSELIKKIQIN